MDNILKVRNLSKNYDGFSLQNVDISLPKGCIMGFIGENGAGKSTTIKLILNLIKKDGGDISIFGEDNIQSEKRIKEDVGVVLDESNFPFTMRGMDIDAVMKNIYKNWNSEVFKQYMQKFNIPLKKTFKEYSRGMKMKLSIAAALSHDAKLLILDEATSGLDPIVRDEILDVFLEFIQDENRSIFISSHIISDLEKITDYITFIHEGKIIFSEPRDALLEKYCVIKCDEEEFKKLSNDVIIGVRKNRFGIEALVFKNKLPQNYETEHTTIEDIMLFYVKGEKA